MATGIHRSCKVEVKQGHAFAGTSTLLTPNCLHKYNGDKNVGNSFQHFFSSSILLEVISD